MKADNNLIMFTEIDPILFPANSKNREEKAQDTAVARAMNSPKNLISLNLRGQIYSIK